MLLTASCRVDNSCSIEFRSLTTLPNGDKMFFSIQTEMGIVPISANAAVSDVLFGLGDLEVVSLFFFGMLLTASSFLLKPICDSWNNIFIHILALMDCLKKVPVGKDQEKAQSEKDSHSKNRGGKKPN